MEGFKGLSGPGARAVEQSAYPIGTLCTKYREYAKGIR
jgi:hypothetical protein